jgi:hypothetical protein
MLSCKAGNKIFFTGGTIVQNGVVKTTDVIDVYDASIDKWTTIQLPVLRSGFALVSAGDKVFFAGGTAGSVITDRIDIYDASTNTWTTDKLSVGRTSLAGANVGNLVLFAGGNTDTDRPTVVDILDLTTGNWTTSSMLSGRSVLTGIALGNKAFFAGGSHSGSASAIVEIYTSNCSNATTSVTHDPGVCKGSSITLTASGVSTYSWSPATGLSSSTGSSVVASPAETTLYEVTGSDVAGCKSKAYTTVTVNPVPVMVQNPASATICAGETIKLSPTNIVEAAWSPSTDLTPHGFVEVLAKPLATTTYTVIGKNSSGCADTAAVVITVKPSPSIELTVDGAQTLCEGESTDMVASGNAMSYSWMPTDGLSPVTGLQVTATPAVTTEYEVIGKGENNCTDTASVQIAVNAIPEQPFIIRVPEISNVLYSSNETGNLWYKDGVLIEGATDKILLVTATGNYTLQITHNNCVSLMSEPMNVVISGIEKHVERPLIHPNPADDLLIIDKGDFVVNKNIEVKILDMLGRIVMKSVLPAGERTMNIRQLTPGIYIFQADQSQRSATARFEKK